MTEIYPDQMKFRIKGQGLIRVLPTTNSSTCPIVFSLYPGKNLGERYFQLTMSSDEIELSFEYGRSKSDRLTLRRRGVFLSGVCSQSWYWISVDTNNRLLKIGRGEAAEKNTIYCFNFSDASQGRTTSFIGVTGAVSNLLAVELLSSIKYWFASGPIYIKKEYLDEMVIPQPKLIIDSIDNTLENIALSDHILIQELPVELGALYGVVGGKKVTLDDPDFPFAEAIHASVVTKGRWCYEKLKQKLKQKGRGHDPRSNYLRITLGKNMGNSPGIPYVMEIWPPHCYSSIHQHSNTFAIIKVLANQVHVDMFSELCVCNQEPYDSVDLMQGQVTYITPNLHQIHKVTNQTAQTSVTLQCYRYPINDTRHYEYFDFIKDRKILNFTPNSDSDFLEFKEIIRSEHLSNIPVPMLPWAGAYGYPNIPVPVSPLPLPNGGPSNFPKPPVGPPNFAMPPGGPSNFPVPTGAPSNLPVPPFVGFSNPPMQPPPKRVLPLPNSPQPYNLNPPPSANPPMGMYIPNSGINLIFLPVTSNFQRPGQLPGLMPGFQPINPQNPMNFPPASASSLAFISSPLNRLPVYAPAYGVPYGNIPQYPRQGVYLGNPGFPGPMVPPNGGGRGMQPPGYPPHRGGTDMQRGPPLSFQERFIEVKPNIMQRIRKIHLLENIINDPNTYIEFQRNGLKITARSEFIQEIVDYMNNLLDTFDLGQNARWVCFQKFWNYLPYDPQVNNAIESAYQGFLPEICRERYVNYSRSVEVTIRGSQYKIQFAQIGGVHRQIRRQGTDVITAVRRWANEEIHNKFIVRNYKWLWMDYDEHFYPYGEDENFLIEQSYVEWKDAGGHTNQNIKNVIIQGCNLAKYEIYYATMTQYNDDTRFLGPIKREPSDQ